MFSVPWTPYESRSTEHLKDLDNTSLSSLNKSPLLHVIHTVLTTAESFSRSLGGIVLPKLYPYQRYKVRVAARNSLGIGRFSSDIKVSEWWYTIFVSNVKNLSRSQGNIDNTYYIDFSSEQLVINHRVSQNLLKRPHPLRLLYYWCGRTQWKLIGMESC